MTFSSSSSGSTTTTNNNNNKTNTTSSSSSGKFWGRLVRSIAGCFRKGRRYENRVAFWFTFLGSFGTLSTILFHTLHMTVFVEFHKVSAEAIVLTHGIFFVWNTVNDLLGGWVVFHYNNRYGSRLGLATLLSFGFALSAALPFFKIPMIDPGLQYFISLSLADGFMSVRAIALGSMVEEIAVSDAHQLCMTRFDMAFGVVEFLVKAIGYSIYDPNDMVRFQVFVLALLGFSIFPQY